MKTRGQFAAAVLKGVGARRTKRNLWALVSWMQAEGGSARFNPLNTTKRMPGSTDYNWVPVQNYTTFAQGVEATVSTLLDGAKMQGDPYDYGNILRSLRGTDVTLDDGKKHTGGWAETTLLAVEDSYWGTGGLAVQCLRGVKKYWDDYRTRPIAGS